MEHADLIARLESIEARYEALGSVLLLLLQRDPAARHLVELAIPHYTASWVEQGMTQAQIRTAEAEVRALCAKSPAPPDAG